MFWFVVSCCFCLEGFFTSVSYLGFFCKIPDHFGMKFRNAYVVFSCVIDSLRNGEMCLQVLWIPTYIFL